MVGLKNIKIIMAAVLINIGVLTMLSFLSKEPLPNNITRARSVTKSFKKNNNLKIAVVKKDKQKATGEMLSLSLLNKSFKSVSDITNSLKKTAKGHKLIPKSKTKQKEKLPVFEGDPVKAPLTYDNPPQAPKRKDLKGKVDLAGSMVEVSHSSGGDYNKNGGYNQNEMVTYKIILKNIGTKDARRLNIKSYINRKVFGYIHDIRGPGADSSRNSILVWRNINLAKGEEKDFSYQAQIKSTKEAKTVKTRIAVITSKNKVLTKLESNKIEIYP